MITIINVKTNVNRSKIRHLSSRKTGTKYVNIDNINSNSSNNELNSLKLFNSKNKSFINEPEVEKNSITENVNVKEKPNEKNYISKVRINRACIYLWFCFVRRRRIMENVLINEGMDLISRRLDIFNIFEKVYKAEQNNDPLLNRTFPMSDECKTGVKLIQLEDSLN